MFYDVIEFELTKKEEKEWQPIGMIFVSLVAQNKEKRRFSFACTFRVTDKQQDGI